VQIWGGSTFVGQEEDVFLKEEQTLWEGSKLSGKQSWPFTFTLPREVTIKEPDTKKESAYRIPPHFTERASPAYIDYRIVITVKRGFLKVNQTYVSSFYFPCLYFARGSTYVNRRLVTKFGYQPLTIAGQPSHLRRLAYSERSPLLGPEGDPEGWKVLPPMTIKGTIFNIHGIEVICTVRRDLCFPVDIEFLPA